MIEIPMDESIQRNGQGRERSYQACTFIPDRKQNWRPDEIELFLDR